MSGLGMNESKLILVADSRGSNKEDKKADTEIDEGEMGVLGSERDVVDKSGEVDGIMEGSG